MQKSIRPPEWVLNRKIVLLVMVCMTSVGAGTRDTLFESVIGSSHDLNTNPRIGADLDTCAFCHVIDGSSGGVSAALDRPGPSSGVIPYGVTTLGSKPSGLSAGSAHCLSCHDGATPLDRVGDRQGTESNTMRELYPESSAILGTDLKVHHPTGVSLPAHPEYAEASALADSDLRLVNGKVECLTCHDVHGPAGIEQLLVRDNDNGALCVSCHIGK